MIRPSPKALFLLALGLPLAALAVWHPMLWWVWALGVCGLGFCFGLDVILAPAPRHVQLGLEPGGTLYLGEPASMALTLQTGALRRGIEAELVCQFEGEMPPMEPLRFAVWRSGEGRVEVPLRPERRGRVGLSEVFVRWSGPMGLFRRVRRFEVDREFSVLPNVVAVRRAAAAYSSRHALGFGLKSTTRRGQGSEFESLREFTQGMSMGQVHWRASARHRKLVGRENRFERNHQVIVAIDTGGLMSERVDGIPRLDQAINAALLLGYVGLKAGDQVGICGFDQDLHTFGRPVRGVGAFQKLVHLASGLGYGEGETNFTLSMARLAERLRQRSILVIMTDFVDAIAAQLMVENLRWLGRRHLILFVALQDRVLHEHTALEPRSLAQVNRAVVARELVDQREVVLGQLRRQGVFCIDTPPEELSERMIDQYLDIYRRELL